jgi:N-acyl-D-amino-acid deacylase
MGTTLLRAGKVVDGTGNRAFDGHVLVEDDCIKAVLKEKEALPPADTVIDAAGYVIAPGFIDVHSHLDWLLPLDDHPELLKRLLEQGITTMVGGNCGCSPAPVTAESVGLMDTFGVVMACIANHLTTIGARWVSSSIELRRQNRL